MKIDPELILRFLKSKKSGVSVGVSIDQLVTIARQEFISSQTDHSTIQPDVIRNICQLVELAFIKKKQYVVDDKINKKEIVLQIYQSLFPNIKGNEEIRKSIERYIEDLHNAGDIKLPKWYKVALYKLWRFLSKKT
jgi:hypothetical protein